ncbi:MAG: transposase [Enterobacteriaceae bacterium]|nr:transposase [Enterobacteriaceae bacterium]
MEIKVFKNFPKDLMEFDKKFSTEESCREYLFIQRWPNGFCCPVCGHKHGWTNKRNLVECSNCHRQTSLTAGTIMGKIKHLGEIFHEICPISYNYTLSFLTSERTFFILCFSSN